MSLTLKDVFDKHFSDVSFDQDFCRRVISFSQTYMTRNDHADFFNNGLLGVTPVRFLDSDRDRWYEDVLEIDETLFLTDFRKVKSINHTFNVMGDAFNYTPSYIVHRLEKAQGVPLTLRKEAQKHAFMVLHYRYITSLIVRRFRRHLADRAVAQAVYNSLSQRFDIKRYKSWRRLLEARSEDLISPGSIYHRTLQNFGPDSGLIRIVTDTQGRIRELIKGIYEIHIQALSDGNRISTVSATMMSTDGEMILREARSGFATYIRYIQQVVQSERSLIREELVSVISSAMHTMPPQLLRESLSYLSRNYGQPGHDYLDELIQEDMLYVFDYLMSNRTLLQRNNDLGGLIAKLRALFMASRSSDPSVLKLRDLSTELVTSSVKTRNSAVIASVRTGVLLYIALRTMTRQYYTQ